MSKIDLRKLKELRDEGKSIKELAETFDVTLAAVYRAVKKTARLTPPPSILNLTPKQRKFIELKSTGISGTEAALQAYDCQDRKSAKEIGSQLMAKPEIKAAMSDWLEWHGCGRDRRAERLAEFVENPDPVIALPALREAMKAGDDYPSTKVDYNVNVPTQIVERIREARERAKIMRERTLKQLAESSADFSTIIDISPDLTRTERGQEE